MTTTTAAGPLPGSHDAPVPRLLRSYGWRILLSAVIVGAATVIAYVAYRAWVRHEASEREKAFGALSLCLLGTEPLRSGELPSDRVAAIKLGVVGIDPAKRTRGGVLPWPAVCSGHAATLADHATGMPVGAEAELLGRALRADRSATADDGEQVDRLWTAAASANVKPAAVTEPVTAPRSVTPLFTPSEFRSLPKLLSGKFTLANVQVEPASHAVVHFVLDQRGTPEGPSSCTVSATDSTVHCAKLPAAVAAVSPGIRLLGVTEDGAAPFFFAGDRGQLGIFSASGERVPIQGIVTGASATKDGALSVLYHRDPSDELRVAVAAPGRPTADHVALGPKAGEAVPQSGLFGHWLVWRQPAPIDSPRDAAHLYARSVDDLARPATDVGSLEEPGPHDSPDREVEPLEGCVSSDGVFIRVRGLRTDHVAFFAGGRWSRPVKTATRGGTFTCHDLEATSTVVEHGSDRGRDSLLITQAKCETSGCTTTKVDMRKLLSELDISPIDAQNGAAADVGGTLLVVWNAGPIGGLRMRAAAPERFKDAEDVVISGTREERGGYAVSSVEAMRLVASDSFAVLFLSTTSGLKVLRIDPAAGRVTPLTATM